MSIDGVRAVSVGKPPCGDTSNWRMMQRYEYMKTNKGSAKSVVAAARKMIEIVWAMLSDQKRF